MDRIAGPMVTTIILSYGHPELTIACLESLVQLSDPLDKIIVCDNNSSRRTQQEILEWAKQQFGKEQIALLDYGLNGLSAEHTKFVFIQNGKNMGFAAGNNSGIRYALNCGADFIWLLNNDTTVDPAALGHLLYAAEKDQAAIVGSTVVFADDPVTVQCAGGCTYTPATTIFKAAMAGEPVAEVITQSTQPHLDYIYGASLFVRQDVFAQCGLLNEEYFLFYEEIDLCLRARQLGFLLGWCRKAIIYHKGSSTVGQPDSGKKKTIAFANYHETLSTLLFSKKFYPLLLPVILLFRFFGKLAVISKKGDWYLLKPLLAAYRDFFRRRNLRNQYILS